ncbi:unnamed protein product [Dibothriocephalus latus]|uniref:Uncharacterized protein n=1 Tax=Dibothriocephalus latus TaxID=60516 RepID=A0A3P7NLT3_DIBLA|nr:unnamed protein product [Dibothriocephalus latus]
MRLNKRDVVRHATHASSLSSRNWRTLVGHNGAPILCLAACLAHGLVASGDKNGRIIVWDLASGSFLHVLRSLQPSPKSPVESPLLEPTLESLDTSSSSSSSSCEDGNDDSNPEAELSRFVEVCGLAFNQLTGDLLTARSSVFGRKVFVADTVLRRVEALFGMVHRILDRLDSVQ